MQSNDHDFTPVLTVAFQFHLSNFFPSHIFDNLAVDYSCTSASWSARSSLHIKGFRPRSFEMDWQGQKLAEQLMQILLLVFAIGGFITGYITGSFQLMVLTYAGGVVLTTLVTVPNWPFFNRNPLKWLDPSVADKYPKPQPQQAVSSKKKASKK